MAVKVAQQTTKPVRVFDDPTISKELKEKMKRDLAEFNGLKPEIESPGSIPVQPIPTFPPAPEPVYTPMFFEQAPAPTIKNQAKAENAPPKPPKATFKNVLDFTLASLMQPISNEQGQWNMQKTPVLSTPTQHMDAITTGNVFTSKDLNVDFSSQATQLAKVVPEMLSNIVGTQNPPKEERIREISEKIHAWRQTQAQEKQVMQVHRAEEAETRDSLEKQETRQLKLEVGDIVYGFRSLSAEERGDQGAYFAWGLRMARRQKEEEQRKKRQAEKVEMPTSKRARGSANIKSSRGETRAASGGNQFNAG